MLGCSHFRLYPSITHRVLAGQQPGRTCRVARRSALKSSDNTIPIGTAMLIGWIPYVDWWHRLPPVGYPAYITKTAESQMAEEDLGAESSIRQRKQATRA